MRFLLVFLLLAAPAMAVCQSNVPGSGFAIEGNLMLGQIYKHTEAFKGPLPQYAGAAELCFVQQTWGKKEWQQRRNFPLVGVGLAYTDYGVDSVYGKCISAFPFVQLPLARGKKLEWTFRLGFGFGYVTRHYERAPVWDTLNNAIGSHLNNYTCFATDLRYSINPHLSLQIGGTFSHISNASIRTPNLGINLWGGHIGFRYYPVSSSPKKIYRTLPALRNRWLAQFRLGIAAKEGSTPNGPLYPVYLVSAYADRRYAGKNKMFAGVDYSYHGEIYAFLRNNEVEPGREKQHSWKSSVFIGNEFLFGRVGIHLQLGVYLKQASLTNDPYYEKLGANFYLIQQEKGFVKECAFAVLLKTHKTQAELAEFGLAFGF